MRSPSSTSEPFETCIDMCSALCSAIAPSPRTSLRRPSQQSSGAFREGRAEINSMPWMIGVARHKVIDHYRKAENEQRRLASVWASGPKHSTEQLDDFEDEDPCRVLEILRGVSPVHRLVLVLRYVDDLAVNEIAQSVGRSVHATESLLVRARRDLVRNFRGADS